MNCAKCSMLAINCAVHSIVLNLRSQINEIAVILSCVHVSALMLSFLGVIPSLAAGTCPRGSGRVRTTKIY